MKEAARLGHAGIALTDVQTVGGAVRAHVAARASPGIRLAQGARISLDIVQGHDPSHDSSHAPPHDSPHDSPHAPPQIELALYASDRDSWGALCRLLSHRLPDGGGVERRPRARLVHDLVAMLSDHPGGKGLLAVLIAPRVPSQSFLEAAEGLSRIMPDRMAVAMRRVDEPEGVVDAERAHTLARALGLPVAATSDVRMHHASRRELLDTVTCIGAGVAIQRAGRLVAPNAERRLRRPEEIFRRYRDCPEALDTAWRFIDRAAQFSLAELRYQYPDEVVPLDRREQGWTAMAHLKEVTWKGARERYPRGVPEKVARQFEHEFAIIADLGYAPYFLTVHEIVAFARARGILCQGRGAAANSAVCFALGVTAVDPERVDMLFERFVSRERNEPPDIDIDFEHERREEVIQHIYAKYGRERAALVCEVICYRGRSAVRDVGKALGIAPDAVERLAAEVDRWGGGGLGTRDDITEERADDGPRPSNAALPLRAALSLRAAGRMRSAGLDPSAPMVIRYAQLVDEILGFPRHRSQHVGGFVISRGPLVETVPIENAAMHDRTMIEWDKDDIDALGMLKIDVLSLGMLTAIRKTIDLVNGDRAAIAAGASAFRSPDAPPVRADLRTVSPPAVAASAAQSLVAPALTPTPALTPLRFHAIPAEDPATYDMICQADTIGVFQIESRAQMSMLPRLRPRCFYDLVIEVALVRPGPIQGDMVHPYLRRRNGEEPIHYPDEAIGKVLRKTLGVPLFQEQAMALAIVAAGFTPGQADELRRAIAAWKRQGNRIAQFGDALKSGMAARGYTSKFASQVFEQIKGFSGYGFPESHAASFALLVYASAWLKRHHPAAFAAALLNSQPLGFYAPAQILRDAADHGVAVRAIDVHCSRWDATLERGIDLARDLARDPAAHHAIPASTVARSSSSSCRRSQLQIDEESLRLHARHPHVRHGAGVIEAWDACRDACRDARRDARQDARWIVLGGVDRRGIDRPDASIPASISTAIPGVFGRLHARGRSVADAAAPASNPEQQPLCAPSSSRSPSPSHDAAVDDVHVPSQPAIRLGLRMIRGLDVEEAHRIVDAVARHGAFRRMSDLQQAASVSVASLRRLAGADAFTSMGLDRQQASWQILALRDRERPLWSFSATSCDIAASPAPDAPEIEQHLPAVAELADIAKDFDATGVTLKRHPIACIRERLDRARAVACSWLRDEARCPTGSIVLVAGLVLVRQRPSTAKGVVFMTIEDESAIANLIFRPKVYERLRTQVRRAMVVCVRGQVERRDGVVHLLVTNAKDVTKALASAQIHAVSKPRDFR